MILMPCFCKINRMILFKGYVMQLMQFLATDERKNRITVGMFLRYSPFENHAD